MSAEDSSGAGRQPSPSWVTANPSCPLAVAQQQVVAAQLHLWEVCTPKDTDYVPDVASRIAAKLSITTYAAEKLAMQAWLLSRWPRLREHFGSLAFPVRHMTAILELTEAVDDEHRSAVEAELLALLTPEVPDQQLPSVRSMSYRVRKIVERIQPAARPLDGGEELLAGAKVGHQKGRLTVRHKTDALTIVFAELPKADGVVLDKALRAVAKAKDCTTAEALMLLVREQVDVQVTLNLYKNTANPTEDVFAEGSWLPAHVSEQWLTKVTHLAAPGFAISEGYSPSEAVKAAVAGRDGGCRFPGCSKEPYLCDVDHVHRYNHDAPEEGGPTNTDNLHLLCRYHHKLKTAGVWDVELRPDGTECWTSADDGHQSISTPYGPLGRETFERRNVRRAKALREHNEACDVAAIVTEALAPEPEHDEEDLPF